MQDGRLGAPGISQHACDLIHPFALLEPLQLRHRTTPLLSLLHLKVGLPEGRDLREILGSTRRVAEGVGSAAATLELARRAAVEMPITEQVHTVLTAGRVTRDAIRELMERRLKQE